MSTYDRCLSQLKHKVELGHAERNRLNAQAAIECTLMVVVWKLNTALTIIENKKGMKQNT